MGVIPTNPMHKLVPRFGGPGAPEVEDSTAVIDKVAGGRE